jgi:predicted RecB family nuclease
VTDARIRRSRSIGGGDVGVCLTRVHHDRFTKAVPVDDAVRQRLAQRGFDHEDAVVDALIEAHGSAVVVIERSGPDPYAATLAAMDDQAYLIVGGRLSSPSRDLVGAPDILVRVGTGYAAIEVKGHKVENETGIPARAVSLDAIADQNGVEVKFRSGRRRDLFQVAHYWRLLTMTGHATESSIGGVIGSEEPYRCLWVDLGAGEDSLLDTASTSTDEAVAAVQTGSRHPERPTEPACWRSECDRCDWKTLCKAQLSEVDDPTLLRGIRSELRADLAAAGITTVAEIAGLSLHDARVDDESVVRQARAMTAGRLLRSDAGTKPIDVPTSPIEVDFDIETYGGRIYLAGFLVTRNGASTFDPVCDWVGTDASEAVLVEAMFARLAAYGDQGAIVFHWHSYERTQLAAAAERHDLMIPGAASVDQWFADHAIDLLVWTKERFESPNGYSLKTIAPLCGFNWRDDDPGGLQSEIWYEEMLNGAAEMQQRLLEYNEDDVAAQRAIRDWIVDHDDGSGPGTAIPSVGIWPIG